MFLNSPFIVSISLLIGICAVIFSTLHNELLHLPEFSGRLSLRRRDEIAVLPIMDARGQAIPFSTAAVLIDIEVHNEGEHAIAVCSEVTRHNQASQLETFQRLIPCGGDRGKQLKFDNQDVTFHVWSTETSLVTSSVHFLSRQQLDALALVHITAENHNSLLSATFHYTVSVSVAGPKNPLFWFHWFNEEYFQTKHVPDQHMRNIMSFAKLHVAKLMVSFGFIKQRIPRMSKVVHTIRVALHSQSCRSFSALWSQWGGAWSRCMLYSLPAPAEELLAMVLPRRDLCDAFLSGGVVAGILVACNVICFFLLKPDNTATTIIKMYSVKRLFFSMFTHFDWIHLLLNMRILIISGSNLLSQLDCDQGLFLWFYVMSGLGGGVISLLWRWARGSCDYCAGASGALYGVSTALALLGLEQMLGGSGVDHSVQLMASVVGPDLVRGLLLGGRGVDTAGHVGGALTGLVLVRWYLDSSPLL